MLALFSLDRVGLALGIKCYGYKSASITHRYDFNFETNIR